MIGQQANHPSPPAARSGDLAGQVAEGRYQYGETDIVGRISRCGDEPARTSLVEAAHTILVRGSKWLALRVWGLSVARRRGMAKAKIAVARKLTVILHRMWVDGSDFRFGKEAVA